MSVYPIVLSQKKFLHNDSLTFPYDERGSQFGDGIYEVIRIYSGNFYLLNEHINRFFQSAEAIKLELPLLKKELISLLLELLRRNKMVDDGKVYLQATRGSAPREHTFPTHSNVNMYAYVKNIPRSRHTLEQGVSVITLRDSRWENCYIKSLNLLPNVLARQEAKEQGCYEAILHKDGIVTECASSNVFLVKNGKVYTHPATNNILHGCVRMAVQRFTSQLHIPFIEKAFALEELYTADELFLTNSISEVMPIVKVDGKQINNGKRGSITEQLQQAYENDANITNHPERNNKQTFR